MGWADVATKHDLAELEERISLRFERLEEHVDGRFNVIGERFNVIDERFNRMDERFDAVGDRIAASASDLRASFEHELRSQITTVMFGLVSVVLTMAALAFALVRFT